MYRNRLQIWWLSGALALSVQLCLAAENEVSADQAVSALESTFGAIPGERRNHTKGTCATGEFIGIPDAAVFSRSALFSGKPVTVIARYSLAGGNSRTPDTAKTARGMALEFMLPDGSLQHMTMLNTPVFGAAQPQTFLDMIAAMKPDPTTGKPDPEKIKAFKASHPDNLAQAEFLAHNNPPSSYANSPYFGIHTFKFINHDNQITLVRWHFAPQDGDKRLSDKELRSSPPDFLEQALIARTRKGPVRWDMILTIGVPGDPDNNPTMTWPESRKQLKIGTLTILSAMPQKGAACENINFDPLVMSDGIAATDDPVLLFRSPAYAVSFAKRLGGL